ncbi:MAG: hypothetical protein KatS3mg113_0982 [Planctomycetaceae bacterium]|nr:MAG: hypothetical protein KatS3mg113_0982 [Planctomycetaceae bacterium]
MKDALTARRVGWYLRELCVWMLLADVVSAQPGGVPHEGVLRPRISRDAQALWEAAAQDQQRKQWSTVFPRWEQLLKTHATELIEVEGVVGSVTWHHARRLSSLPAVVRREWERYFLPTLNMVWNEWLQRREESIIRNFLCLAVGTSQEVMGLRHFAARHRELGHWASARIALQRIISHSQATPAEKARAYVGLWELSRLDNLPLPDSGIPEQEASLWQQSVTRGEETRSLREWYTVLLAPDRTPSKRRTMPPGRSLTDIPWQQLRFHDLPEPLLSAWQEWEPLYRQAGAMPLLVHSPLIVGPHLIFRSTKELTAWDISVLEQPREIWRVDLSQEWSWLHTNPGLLENRGFRMLLVEQLYRRFYADSCWGRMTTDGTRIFLVRDTLPLGAGSTGGQASVWPPRPASNRHDSRVNQVLAFDIVLGELSWQAGGHSSGDSYPLVRHYFFGPPTPWDSYVLGIAQADMELRLVALEADSGAWSWSVVLGDLPQLAQDSLLRQRLACPIWFHQGQAICTTSAGALVAVDLLWHHVIWVARYPVATPPLITDERLAHSPLLRDPWWRGWRENTGHLDQQVLWFSPGEADQLLAVDLTTGQTIGQIPRREAQWFLGLVSDQLLMLEPTALRAHHPHTGSLLWREEVGEVVGKPLLVNNQIMLATLPAGWMILDSKNRQRHYIQTLPNIPFFPVHSLLRLMPNSDRDTVQQVGIVATPGEWHVFDIPQPAPQSAQHILSSEHTSSALKLRTALSELSRDPAVLVPLEHALNVQELTVEQQLLWTCGLARAEGRLGQCMQAAKRLLTHESLFHPELYLTLHHPARQVRADLFYLGTWQELIDRASDTERQRLHELFRDHARNLQQQGFDPFAWQRWYLLWHQHKWGETAEWLQEPSVTRGLPWRTLEAWVFSGTDSSQRQLKHAWLAEQYRHAGMLSAAWIHQQLAPPPCKTSREPRSSRRSALDSPLAE